DSAFIDQQLQQAVSQYKVMMDKVPDDRLPKSYRAGDDRLITSGSGSWTSGFYPGTLLLLYEFSGDASLLAEAKEKLRLLEKEQQTRGTHDLGCMVDCSFGPALALSGDTSYRSVLLPGAESFISRFDPEVGCIKRWDHNCDQWKCPVIIENV